MRVERRWAVLEVATTQSTEPRVYGRKKYSAWRDCQYLMFVARGLRIRQDGLPDPAVLVAVPPSPC
jgi:hypothetical protein